MQAWTKAVAARVHEVIWTEVDLEVIKEAEPPPPAPPPEPEPVKAEPAPPPPAALKEVPKEAPAAPPPAAAQAGAVLAAPSDPDEPVDLTGAFVQGTGDSYAGGTTQATGTSKSAVRDPNARGTGVQGGTGTGPAAPAVNLSRPASCASESLWRNCPFPAEADTAQVDEAFVLLRATVESSGTISAVTILEDPGNGFGREAKRWALATVKCQPALDASGTAVSGQSTVRVRFNRD
jgi:protein TonB